MKRKRLRKNKTSRNTKNESKEFVIGLLTIVLLLVIIAKLFNYLPSLKFFPDKSAQALFATPSVQINYCSKNITPSPLPTKKIATYIVKDGDSFWKISEAVCGSGKFSESIRRQNNYTWQSLLLGDVIKISCQ